jgi:AcrR family transcriptional regulator
VPKSEAPTTSRGKRLAAADRKQLIMDGARRAFSASGDVRGTTIKRIAEEAGISEGIIYRHFESKEELFVQAAVDPLTEAINSLLDKFSRLQLELTGRDLNELAMQYWADLIEALTELVPLLGLVLFGDPEYAVPFYRDVLVPGLDKVSKSWSSAYRRITGDTYPHPYAVMSHFGVALMFAIDQRLGEKPPPPAKMASAIAAMEAPRLGAMLLEGLARGGVRSAATAAQTSKPKPKQSGAKQASSKQPVAKKAPRKGAQR